MIILWITNFPLPAVQNALGLKHNPKEGWLVQLSEQLGKIEDKKIFILSPSNELKSISRAVIQNIEYITYPLKLIKNSSGNEFWKNIKSEIKPDIIHIHGSENIYGLKWIENCGNSGVVVSIQGMPSLHKRYFFAGIPYKDIIRFTTIGDFIRDGNLIKTYLNFVKSGKNELSLISNINNIIGRTNWDKAHVWAINNDCKYFFCNETLRKSFYEHKWNYSECDKYSIFISQATLPLKGAHKLIEAVGIVKKHYPQVKLRIAMCVNITDKPFIERFKRRNYGAYIKHLINKNKLEKNIEVLGQLSENEMLVAYLKSHIFISPSSIENSPNSLGEAQLLGMPTIASYVGGTEDIADHGRATDLYRFEEVEMLAFKIVNIFKNELDYNKLEYARNLAFQRHNLNANIEQLNQVYNTIMENNLCL